MKQYITFHIWPKYNKYLIQYLCKEYIFFTNVYFIIFVGTISADVLTAYIEEQGK